MQQDYVLRLQTELNDLNDKRGKLEVFILSSPVFKALSERKKRLMRQQYDAMTLYAGILKERMDLEVSEGQ